jgi:hypothetical protein
MSSTLFTFTCSFDRDWIDLGPILFRNHSRQLLSRRGQLLCSWNWYHQSLPRMGVSTIFSLCELRAQPSSETNHFVSFRVSFSSWQRKSPAEQAKTRLEYEAKQAKEKLESAVSTK